MGQVSEKYDWGNSQKKRKEKCMPFYHSPRSYVSKVVSIIRNKSTWIEEIDKTTLGGQKKKRQFKGEVH
jgi:hypothetical protein